MTPDLALLLYRFLDFYLYVVIARVFVTWIIRDEGHIVNRVLGTFTDPFTRPLRPYLTFGMMDFSPIALMLVVQLLQSLIAPYTL